MKILGIDPGTETTGFGVIEAGGGGKLTLIDGGVIKTPAKQSDSIRLRTIYEELSEIIRQTKPEVMAVEKLFFAQNVTTAMTVSQARGVILLSGEINKLPIFEYTPLQIKQAITGYGRAEKAQMQEMVKVILKLPKIPKPDDCADALACAICHANSARFA